MSDERDIEQEDVLVRRAKQAFDESVESLDAATLSRLNRSRHAALERGAGSHALLRPVPVLAASGAALAVIAAVFLVGNPAVTPEGGLPDMEPDVVADTEILLQGEDFEMLEDLEFYSWLELEAEVAHVG